MPFKALVVGGAGAMGRWCVSFLKRSGFEVAIASRGDASEAAASLDVRQVSIDDAGNFDVGSAFRPYRRDRRFCRLRRAANAAGLFAHGPVVAEEGPDVDDAETCAGGRGGARRAPVVRPGHGVDRRAQRSADPLGPQRPVAPGHARAVRACRCPCHDCDGRGARRKDGRRTGTHPFHVHRLGAGAGAPRHPAR